MSVQTRSIQRVSDIRFPRFEDVVRDLARFRYALRIFLRFSETAARECGVTPQQHQLMLGVAGFSGRGSATITELAEFLQERHHSVVGLVGRAVRRGLVRTTQDRDDRRVVIVSLTATGRRLLTRLSALHGREVGRMRALMDASEIGNSPSFRQTTRRSKTARPVTPNSIH
ncbi:MAG TPA: MarR family winged helix-turn-helix transcriptional regulator [Acidobacteriaceae bacterium]|nr:MarR family winged helix-turn-helix transcriptional regulator [Acidobacteriaceae bacterium]